MLYHLSLEKLCQLEKFYEAAYPEDTNPEITMLDFDTEFTLDTDEDKMLAFDKVSKFFGSSDRMRRIFQYYADQHGVTL